MLSRVAAGQAAALCSRLGAASCSQQQSAFKRGYAAGEASPATTSGKSWVPDWVKTLLPGSKDLDSGAARRATPSAASTSSSGEVDPKTGKKKDNPWDDFYRTAQMTLDGYADMTKDYILSRDPPAVRLPPVAPNHRDYTKFLDSARVQYLRLRQHNAIISSFMTTEEKERVIKEGKDVVKDKAFLQAIADRSGMYIDLEVKDVVDAFWQMRDRARLMLMGKARRRLEVPPDNQAAEKLIKEMKEFDKRAQWLQALRRRDRAGCPCLAALPLVGRRVECSLTGLEYRYCCGGSVPRFTEPYKLPHPNAIKPDYKKRGKPGWVQNKMKRPMRKYTEGLVLMRKTKYESY